MKNISPLIFISLSIIGFTTFFAIFAPDMTSYDPSQMNLSQRLLPPSSQNYFGTDQNGVDIFSQILFGARVSLSIAFSVIAISLLLGLFIGSLAGYCGGWVDILIMRMVDVVFAFPGFLLILTLAAIIQSSSLWNVIFVLSVTGWASYARLVRGEIHHLKHKVHVLGAEALGASHLRKLVFHIWPQLVGPMTVQASFGMAAVIITESSLNFLGIGLSPSVPSWGGLLSSGRHYLIEAPHISLFPGLALLMLVLSFNLLGDGLRDMLDPKSSAKLDKQGSQP